MFCEQRACLHSRALMQEKYPNQEIPAPIKLLLWIFTPAPPGTPIWLVRAASHSSSETWPLSSKAVADSSMQTHMRHVNTHPARIEYLRVMKAGDRCHCQILCMTIRRIAENTQANHQCACEAHLPGRAQAAGRAERSCICCAEDQALSEEGVQPLLLSRFPAQMQRSTTQPMIHWDIAPTQGARCRIQDQA